MSTWNKTADVAILGGGILGVSSAYFLSRRSRLRIVLLEKDGLAQATTGLSVGGLRQQFSHPSNILLSQKTLAFFEQFQKEFQVPLGFNKVGYLFLAQKENTWKDFLSSVQTQKQHNVPVETLLPNEIQKRWPYLNVTDLKGGTFCAEDGYADPYEVTMAMAKIAKQHGAAIFEETEVTGILRDGDKVKGVQTSRGDLAAPIVINAAGPWSGNIGRMAGRNYPVFPFRRQVFVTKAFKDVPRPIPLILDFDSLFYFREEGPSILMGKSDPEEPSSFNVSVDRKFMEAVIEAACHRAPILNSARIAKGWGGLYTITPDENPIIGEDPHIKGFYNAIGFSGHGFQHGPAVGQLLSNLILYESTEYDLTPFSSERFKTGSFSGEKRVV
jgi:sarcosine oxidase subunit beta